MEEIKELRIGSLLLAISQVMLLGIIAFVYIMFFSQTFSFTFALSSSDLLYVGIAGFVIVGIVAVGYYYLLQGFAKVDKAGYIGSLLFFVSLFLFLIDIPTAINVAKQFFSLSLSKMIIAIAPILISFILLVISNVMVGIGFYHLGARYNSNMLKLGGASLGASAFLDFLLPEDVSLFLPLVSFFLIYMGLGSVEPQIKVMQAVVKDNYVYVLLNSNANGVIISAKIEGGAVVEVNPTSIAPGQNTIAIKFNGKTTTTTVTLTVITAKGIKEITTAAVAFQERNI